ncbi:MAG: DUF3987 domain-containing protein, partial [Nitrospira sp.]|nr:DUF3987 domain-containing protein [Nitrospira sp.]
AGDGFALIQKKRRCTFPEAVRLVSNVIGYCSASAAPNGHAAAHASLTPVTTMPEGEIGRDLFVYENAEGAPVICVKRIDLPDEGKTFRQLGRTADGAAWQKNLDHAPKPRPLYRLRAILADTGSSIVLHEGEKACEAAVKADLPGIHTTTLGGASNPKHTDFSPLKSWGVVICRDNDEPGEAYSTEAARLCHEAGAKSVKVLLLPGLPPKGDVVEWLQAGGTPEQFAALIEQAEPVHATHHEAGPVSVSGLPADTWPEPLPLVSKVEAVPYPLDALPNKIRSAVEEVRDFTQAPIALVASSALASLSASAQVHIDVKRADRLEGPTGLFILSIADSGERKSTVDSFFSGPLRNYDRDEAEKAKPALRLHAARYAAWNAEREGILIAIKQAAKTGKSLEDLKSKLSGIESQQPVPPRVPRILHGDDTPEALSYALAKHWPSASVMTAEAGTLFGSHGMSADSVMRNLALLNTLWDGGTHQVGRRTSETYTVRGARLTLGLQVQAATLRTFLERSGGLARGTGFLARFLIAWPESTQGSRTFKESPAAWPALDAFHRRISEILDIPVTPDSEGALTPTIVELEPEAKAAWVTFHDAIEEKLKTGGELCDVRDMASKIADNAARIAALFQYFCSNFSSSNVTFGQMEASCRIAAWYLHEARRFFSELALPPEFAWPARLETWLIKYCQKQTVTRIKTGVVQQYGPGGLRTKAPLMAAVKQLENLHRIRVHEEGAGTIIELNPSLLSRKEDL